MCVADSKQGAQQQLTGQGQSQVYLVMYIGSVSCKLCSWLPVNRCLCVCDASQFAILIMPSAAPIV
jgi:hypothetical protein